MKKHYDKYDYTDKTNNIFTERLLFKIFMNSLYDNIKSLNSHIKIIKISECKQYTKRKAIRLLKYRKRMLRR